MDRMMLLLLLIPWLAILPTGSGIVNCRIACRHCREKREHPEMLEVYCAMCAECKERRREWLEGAPSLLRVEKDEEYLTNYGIQEQDECPTTPIDEDCDEPVLLTQTVPTTTTTTTTTSTTTTTRRPCPPRPCVRSTRPPCQSLACAIPMAIPVCPMCPVQMSGSFYTMTAVPSSVTESTTAKSTTVVTSETLAKTSASSEMYFYLGVPKKFLKQLQLSKS